MTIFVNRSIPLGEESRNGWISAGCVLLARSDARFDRQIGESTARDVLLFLGYADLVDAFDGVVYNDRSSINSVYSPAALRRTIPELIPPQTGHPHWHKGPGQHGENKWLHQVACNEPVRNGWDLQQHIEGDEYRVITVGPVVVQAHRKTGTMPNFVWSWCGVEGIGNLGIVPLLKGAVALVPGGERTVLGWDIIVRRGRKPKPFIIEANTSMGVNTATAQRIVNQIRKAT